MLPPLSAQRDALRLTRPGDYGGAFENRTRLLRNAIFAAKGATSGEFLITSRVNLYDGFAYPYGSAFLQRAASCLT